MKTLVQQVHEASSTTKHSLTMNIVVTRDNGTLMVKGCWHCGLPLIDVGILASAFQGSLWEKHCRRVLKGVHVVLAPTKCNVVEAVVVKSLKMRQTTSNHKQLSVHI